MADGFGDTQKEARLRAYLAALPGGMALKLLTGLERAMIAGEGAGLPVDFIRESIRPALRSLEGRRPGFATAQRLFCLPFEDVLVNARPGGKIRGIVERGSIAPLWDVMRHDLLPDTFPDLTARVSRHILKKDQEALSASLSVMRRAAAGALLEAARHAEGDEDYRRTMIERLGSAECAGDALDMAHILAIGDDVLHMRARLAGQAGELDEAALRAVRETFEKVLGDAPDQAVYVPLVAMGALTRPWQILRLVKSLHQSEAKAAAGDLGAALCERLLSEMEDMGARIAACRPGVTSLEVVADEAVRLANMSKGLAEEAELARLSGWEQRLFALRTKVSQVIGDHLARFERDLHLALPLQQSGMFGQGIVSRVDLAKPFNREKAAKVREQLHFVLATWHRADALGLSQHYRDMKTLLEAYLEIYREALVNELRLARPKPAGEPEAAAFAAELSDLLEGGEAGDIFRRRLRVAMQETA